MNSPFISVIIPFYNIERSFIERCVNSVIAQTYNNFECIIVNDGSDPEYLDLLKEIKYLDERIKVIHKSNGGLGSARNFGVQNAKGIYLFFLDSDDYISPYTLKNGLDIATRTNANMVIGGLKHVTLEEKPFFPKIENKIEVIETQEEKKKYILHISGIKQNKFLLESGSTGISACSKLIKKEVALAVPFENDKYWDEDNLWNIASVAHCNRLVVADILWYAYVINPNSMVRGYNGDRSYEFQFRAKQEYNQIKELWPECMQSAYYQIWDGFLRFCRTDTYNKRNPNSETQRYENFCKAISFAEFIESIQKINFNFENRIKYRIAKKTIQRLLMLKNKKLAFMALYFCNKKIQF